VVLLQSGHLIANDGSLFTHGALYGEDEERGPAAIFRILYRCADMTCKTCRIPMKELKGHIYHKKRKWKCPKCGRVRMQELKPR